MRPSVCRLSSGFRPGVISRFGLFLMYVCINLPLVAQSPSQPLLSLVASERAFAAATAHLGVRDGFLTFFADNALTFEPELGSYKDALKQRRQPSFPLGTLLRWAPEEGDVSSAGDLGYLTGPFTVESVPPGSGPIAGGWYFSIWKKQPDSTWKVFIDVGIETPPHGIAVDSVIFTPAPLHGTEVSGGTSTALRTADAEVNRELMQETPDLDSYLGPGVRLHRNGQFPVKTVTEIKEYLRTHPSRSAQAIAADVSQTGDLGYTYGTYASASASGYYVRVWKLTAPATWKIVLDVATEKR